MGGPGSWTIHPVSRMFRDANLMEIGAWQRCRDPAGVLGWGRELMALMG